MYLVLLTIRLFIHPSPLFMLLLKKPPDQQLDMALRQGLHSIDLLGHA